MLKLCKGHCSDDDELMQGEGGRERGAEVGEVVRAAWISRGRVARARKVLSRERETYFRVCSISTSHNVIRRGPIL